ncbi:hypothetical protein CFE70_005838 [Pyrenophora teres f. teres 0-1]|uniref:Uncharacterized protein n=1 Tax=Pyrenophora teres f. teres (strain 0-1) TaxID=861557 RepID=E3RU18_PYRTT|nr:hypothetical protein PTT_12555 [Pyrenophora teres f. teres 0-1]KAK1919774.1 hypothetical protein P3342_002067 [Pyrenophora teres f. teres]
MSSTHEERKHFLESNAVARHLQYRATKALVEAAATSQPLTQAELNAPMGWQMKEIQEARNALRADYATKAKAKEDGEDK